MRDSGLMIVILLVLLLAGVMVYVQKGSLGAVAGTVLRTTFSLPAPPSAEVKPEAKEEPKTAGSRKPGNRKSAEPDPLQLAAAFHSSEPEIIVVDVPGPVFPTASDIRTGMEWSVLLETFGSPNLKTVTLDGGRIVETVVYLQKDRRMATYARLANGRVVSARTTNY